MLDIHGHDVSMKVAQQRLRNKGKHGKPAPLCLACGEPATNDLPTCNSPKCVKLVKPVTHWARQVADWAVGARLHA